MSGKLRIMLALDIMRLPEEEIIQVAKIIEKLQPDAIVDGELDFWSFSSAMLRKVYIAVQIIMRNKQKCILSMEELKKKVQGNEVMLNAVKEYLPNYLFEDDSDSDSSSDEEVIDSTFHSDKTEENFKKLLDSSYYCNVFTDDINKSVKIIMKRDIKVHLDLSESDTDGEDEIEESIPLDPSETTELALISDTDGYELQWNAENRRKYFKNSTMYYV
ncbi:hypothetical protein KQX54_004245 [Cotesia glomerata]|uniref:Uncharacterized protein n=1 Tax=Cotesia glomerata TaxID=32391 RepID=A0AAV7IFL9_COTGL|nr:hypothetical protein KQX54_004245 [Cotesia glomerata]